MILLLFSIVLAAGPCKAKDPNLAQFKAISDKVKEQQLVPIDNTYPWLVTSQIDSKRWKIKLSKP